MLSELRIPVSRGIQTFQLAEEDSEKVPAREAPELKSASWSAKAGRRGDVLTLKAEIENVPNGTDGVLTIYEYDAGGINDKVTTIPVTIKANEIELKWEYEYCEDTAKLPLILHRRVDSVAVELIAAEHRDQGGMRIHDCTPVAINEFGRQETHEAGEHDELRVERLELFEQGVIESFECAVAVAFDEFFTGDC